MTALHAALNGDREHPAAPRTPDEIARDSVIAARAGAQSVHVHAFDDKGVETLAADACEAVVRAIRRDCPNLPVSLTTSAAILADAPARLAAIRGWTTLPTAVTANQGEEGIVQLCEHLMSRGVGIEAGLLCVQDARKFAEWAGRHQCIRVLIEPLDPDPDQAVRHAAAMEAIVRDAGVTLDQVHHGDELASWSVSRRALSRGHGIRAGLEDASVLQDGSVAKDNGELLRAAGALVRQAQPPWA